MKYLVVGGVAGGATTVARLRRLDENAEIIMFDRGEYISYANCGLPYYIGGVIAERDNLFVQTPESFGGRFGMDVRTKSEVLSIDPAAKTVKVKNLATAEEYSENYDKLVLSPGAEPVRPPLPGIGLPGIFTMRNVPDTDKIKNYVDTRKPAHAVVVGAGFIGLEMAENLHSLGVKVTIIEMAEQVMTPLDYSMAAQVHQHLKMKNVEFYLNTAVSSFEDRQGRIQIALNNTKTIETDMVILSIGVRPESKLAKEAGLKIGETGGIWVNEYLQTSDPDIYALGDAIEFTNPITGKPMITYLAGPANKQGRIVANNIAKGNKHIYKGAINTAIAKVFDITVASAGVPGKLLGKLSIAHTDSVTHSSSHAGYYPGAQPMTIKISFCPNTGKLLGAQAVGYDGVDKRIDLLAEAIRRGCTVYDLAEIEHAYAPPFSSAKDPVNIAGMVAQNILDGTTKTIWWRELASGNKDYFLLDVRNPEEFELGSIDSAINIPLDKLRQNIDKLPKGRPIAVFCGVGLRAHVACRILTQTGYEAYNLSGGLATYDTCTQKQSNEDIFGSNYIGNDDQIYKAAPAAKAVKEIASLQLDACGMQCPGPIMKLKTGIDGIAEGEKLVITASDPGFYKDVQSWANVTGNTVLELSSEQGKITATLQKTSANKQNTEKQKSNGATFICFSDDLDKALATFVLANGAAAAGKKVSIFFTFWGLNVIKKTDKKPVKKDLFGKMFGMMMPSSSKKLGLSKMNFSGMGSSMMRSVMRNKNVDSLENMILSASAAGVQMIACQMSMDVMGIQETELIEGVEIGGVAAYMEQAENSGLNLFI
jgi:NADPH-dependent 2,4-dienoyl-CoA reductase/sulfur reductase-like enzyme/peroxiredoxin family protein/rhodanese-related sulfurtransferase/TusA-related sulfurtransferase